MKATFVSKENNDVTFNMEFDADELENAKIEVYKSTKGRYSVNGFRKGKAPRKIIEQHYGPGVFLEEALENLLQENYPKALAELTIDPIDQPKIDFDAFNEGEALEGFKAIVTVAVPPEVEIKDYTGIKIKDVVYEVTDEDVTQEIERIRQRNARLIDTAEAAESGDTVNIDYSGSVDGEKFDGGTAENYNLKLGSGMFIPGFEEQLVGVKAGDETDVNVTFPEDYSAENLKGKDAVFHVVVHEVKREEMPELDDEFAQDVSEFESLDELKQDIEKKLKDGAVERAEAEKKNAVLEALYEANEVDIPDVMVETRMDAMMDEFAQSLSQQGIAMRQYFTYLNQNPADFRETLRNDAYKYVKMRCLIKAVAAAEDYDASDEEIEQELERMAEQYKIEPEKLKEALDEQQRVMLRDDIKNKKAVDYMFETAIIES
jgi:trigger factor